jgi:hypothetical protein
MYTGHIGIALGARRWTAAVPLWALIVAAQFPDWGDVAVCSIGIPGFAHGMLTHSVPAVLIFAVVGGIATRVATNRWDAAKIVALLIISHYFADLLTGFKPTFPGMPRIGLELYRRPALDFILESAVILWGWWMYRSTFPPAKRNSPPIRAILIGLILFQAVADIAIAIIPRIEKC